MESKAVQKINSLVWVTGKDGMLGSEICSALKAAGIFFVSTGSEVDICNFEELHSFVKKNITLKNYSLSFLINCAAYTKVDMAEVEKEKCFNVNKTGVENLSKIAAGLNAVLIHFSTDYVFDGKGEKSTDGKLRPYVESDETNPINVYGKSKLEGEEAIKKIASKYFIFRTSWLYGVNGKNFVCTILNLLKTKKQIKVVHDQRGTPTNCKTLSDTVLKIIQNSYKKGYSKALIPFGTYNLTDSGETTWFDFALYIQKTASLKTPELSVCKIIPCTTSEYPAPASRPSYTVLDKTKITESFKIELPDWKKSLKEFL